MDTSEGGRDVDENDLNSQSSKLSYSKRKRLRRKRNAKKTSDIEIGDRSIENVSKATIVTSEPLIKVDNAKTIRTAVDSSVETVNSKKNIESSNNTKDIERKDSEDKPFKMEQTKTREEIMAEREAKKLAKQMAKNKKKGDQNVAPSKENQPVIAKSEKSQPVEKKENPKPEAKISQKPSAEKKENPKPEAKIIQKPSVENKESPKPEAKIIQKPPVEKLPSSEGQEKSKSELRAERRAKQEAQRAAKAQLSVEKDKKSKPAEKPKSEPGKTKPTIAKIQSPDTRKSPIADKAKVVQIKHKVKLFNHLYIEDDKFQIPLNAKDIPPIIVRLGVQYKSNIIVGSNARCVALLNALRKVIDEYVVPANVELSRGLEGHLDMCMKFLNSCRPVAVSMINAMTYVKSKLRKLAIDIGEDGAKTEICKDIDRYINEQIDTAGEAISNTVNGKIANGDVILTYGCSSLIEKILVDASKNPKEFSVIVVAANPWNEGAEMLRRLVKRNIKCSLVMISALSFIMRKIDKVILGAGALLANGYVMARAGTAQVAMVAHAYNVPVLICCEAHKFSERAQTDSFVYNEIGSPDDLFKSNLGSNGTVSDWRAYDTLTPLHLKYDVTPPDLVNAVVTEKGILPCTSVPVLLRIRPTD